MGKTQKKFSRPEKKPKVKSKAPKIRMNDLDNLDGWYERALLAGHSKKVIQPC